MLCSLKDAARDTSGGKAAALGALLRAGMPVPDGFVIPFDAHRAIVGDPPPRDGESERPEATGRAIATVPLPAGFLDALARALEELGGGPVAVRSSAQDEDTALGAGAGRYESVLAVRGVAGVADALRICWASLYSSRACGHPSHTPAGAPSGSPTMAVIVQRLVDAEISGVMFTPAGPDDSTRIEASWGLGPSIVEGTVTPDSYRIAADGTITRIVSEKHSRLDRDDGRLVTREVPAHSRNRATLDATAAARLGALGQKVAAALGGPQDIEWALADDRIHILQARPITAALPAAPATARAIRGVTLAGTPGSQGAASGIARIIRDAGDFGRVRPGDILICPYTDPSWTPLLRLAAGIVTETGGALSHAAIVARELRIPAVLGVREAIARLKDGTTISVDGTAGTVAMSKIRDTR